MQFPNNIQAALLFDRSVDVLDVAMRNFLRVEEARTGARLATPESKPGVFYRMFGGDELMVTLEYVDGPPNAELFKPALSSTVTSLLCPDIRERLATSRSHILIDVSHGVLGNSPVIVKMLEQMDYPLAGSSLPKFLRRLDVCTLLSRIVSDEAVPQAVHWTQSDQLIAGGSFESYAQLQAPGPLHIHPFLFGDAATAASQPKVGIRTFGARHFIGGEVVVEPSVLPWSANYETILAFLKIATKEHGYIIPDGDTFGPEDRSLLYRVVHRPLEEGDVKVYELQPLIHREFGFVAEGYVPPERTVDDRAPPQELMPEGEDGDALIEEWKEKRAMAEKAGARFQVHAIEAPPGDPPPTGAPSPIAPPPVRPGSPLAGLGNRPVFGRKRA